MAVVKKLYFEKGKSIPKQSEIVAEYNMDNEYFSIWSYKKGDFQRAESSKQNIQFDSKIAEELYEALGQFLHK